jgi:amino-acid N-acetyltransferase
MIIRTATVQDVPGIAALITTFAQRGKMLFRSHAELYEAVRDFHVAEAEPGEWPEPPSGNGVESSRIPASRIKGACALEIVWGDLAEVRSLAVDPACQKKGIGQALVRATIEEARRLQIARVFALTYEEAFFARLGFHVVDKSALPLKVWSVCIKCPKRDGCDEIAMVRTVLDRAAPLPDQPNEHADLRYEVPTQLVQLNRAGHQA